MTDGLSIKRSCPEHPEDCCSKLSYEHFKVFSCHEQQAWLEQSCDVELWTSDRVRVATHAVSLQQWSGVLGNCVTATIKSSHMSSEAPYVRIPVDISSAVLTEMLSLLYRGYSDESMVKLMKRNKAAFREVMAAAEEYDACVLLTHMERVVAQYLQQQNDFREAMYWAGPACDLHLEKLFFTCLTVLQTQGRALVRSQQIDITSLSKMPARLLAEMYCSAATYGF